MFTAILQPTPDLVWGEVRRLEAGCGVPMPAGWLPRALMPGLFCVRSGGSVGLTIDPALAVGAGIAGLEGAVYGVFNGALLARALKVLRAAVLPGAAVQGGAVAATGPSRTKPTLSLRGSRRNWA